MAFPWAVALKKSDNLVERFPRVMVKQITGGEAVGDVPGDGKETMRIRIEDEFTLLPISRQRKYQLRMQRDGRCTECGESAAKGSRCVKHLVKARERQRKKRGLKRRYYGTLSYKLQAAA